MAIPEPGMPHPGWVPPTDLERVLAEAKSRGDWDGYLLVLLSTDVLAYVLVDGAEKHGATSDWPLHHMPDGRAYVPLHTRGELLPRRPEVVPQVIPLPINPEIRLGEPLHGVIVNPGTPTEAVFPDLRKLEEHWSRLRKDALRPGHDDDAVITQYTGPRQGPLAHALACGAHLAVHNQVPWNSLDDVFNDHDADTDVLSDSWDVHSQDDWVHEVDALIRAQNSPPEPEFLLSVRWRYGERVSGLTEDPFVWRALVARILRHNGATEEEVALHQRLIDRIVRYETRFRADGLLSADEYVVSARAYDYGRAVPFARWGLGARLASPEQAEFAVLKAGERSREWYDSWGEFSAGYTLGRALRFDDGSFGHMYGSALSPHRLLMGEPLSPWRTIPFAQDEDENEDGDEG
ncbi:DUF1266 domain-containing protein [Streptomyces oceani]|uniref:Uncharacterized protein n=1 Tax=Streptomyces oceani TaxID=1075402 RepID=A0A1E7JZD9_9ACTN|nr:DUF1266 domain-containing protein [Streptomyces oceani]OEU97022.1 hypothetical protein AN216_17335 [Streptomyces oceani]